MLSFAPCRNDHVCPRRKQGRCLFHHEDSQQQEETLCLRDAMQQQQKLLKRFENLFAVQTQEVLGHETEDISDQSNDGEASGESLDTEPPMFDMTADTKQKDSSVRDETWTKICKTPWSTQTRRTVLRMTRRRSRIHAPWPILTKRKICQ